MHTDTDTEMLPVDYEIIQESHQTRLDRFMKIWKRGFDAMCFSVEQITLVWEYFEQHNLDSAHNKFFIDFALIPGVDESWVLNQTENKVELPYDLYMNRFNIERDVVRLETMSSLILELLNSHTIPPENIWYQFLDWTSNFCTYSELSENDMPSKPSMVQDELSDSSEIFYPNGHVTSVQIHIV